MQGSLTLHRGILYVGSHEKTAHVRAYDLDGRELSEGFSFRDERVHRSVVAGIAVDDDRLLWIADTPSSRVRTFTVFGQEVGGLGAGLSESLEGLAAVDTAGLVRAPVDVEVRGDTDGRQLFVASGGLRRHAVQVFDGEGTLIRSLRPRGHADRQFDRVQGISLAGRFVYVAEGGGGQVQVFRDGDFHFQFAPVSRSPQRFWPTAVAPLEDGRIIVCAGGEASSLLLFDSAGRLLRQLAQGGDEEGCVMEPSDVVVEPGQDDRSTRLAVLDRDGDRVQVFTIEGQCFGAFASRAI